MTNTSYFTSYIPGTEVTVSLLQSQFGPQLEKLDYVEKTLFRAALTTYVANYSAHDQDNEGDFMDACIEGAGVDWDIWDNDRLVSAIQMCQTLHEDDMEALIDSLSEQIRSKIYSSRGT